MSTIVTFDQSESFESNFDRKNFIKHESMRLSCFFFLLFIST